jgi:fructose-bisphosphate aldolase class II
MNYKDFGLVNTKDMFARAMAGGYAIPAFNFYNMETLKAILSAAADTKSPVILAVSESALGYMGADFLMGMIRGQNFRPGSIALHLDHGASMESCIRAIDFGFSSVMIDGSRLPISENIAQTKQVVEYARRFDVTTEAELGILSGIEDENTAADKNVYTNPDDVVRFVKETGCDSLAIAIGTSHGAYKRKSDSEELRFDILDKIAKLLPNFPLVLHGASSIPERLVDKINEFGGSLGGARGIPIQQLRRAVSKNICKINVDSDARLAFTAAVRQSLATTPDNFDPRKYLAAAMAEIKEIYISEINDIMNSENKLYA